MKRLATLVLSAAVATATPAAAAERTYFVDGANRHDGMSAHLSVEDQFLRVTSDRMELSSCHTPHFLECFSSSYMTFAFPMQSAARWEAAGFEFQTVRHHAAVPAVPDLAVVRSVQPHGTFTFFFSRERGLLGWQLLRTGPSGKEIDNWFAEGFGHLVEPQPNNSSKPTPLRGAA